MSVLRSVARFAPVLPVVIAAVGVGWWLLNDDGQPDPVEIAAAGPRFSTVAELAGASDLVVHARIVAVDGGRTITDPARPDAGIRTQLGHVEVLETLAGSVDGPLVVEQEAALLDGTPVVVNGVAPLVEGDTGVMFLVRGTTEEFPYTALLNEQAWVPVADDRLHPLDPADPLWNGWQGRPVEELSAALAP